MNHLLSTKQLVLFFTKGISLKEWRKIGHLSREINIYNRLTSHVDVAFLTYDSDQEFIDSDKIGQIKVLPRTHEIGSNLYSLLIPFLYRKQLKDADFYKTNQMNGAWTAVLAKLLFRKKLIVRTGFQWSIFLKKQNDSTLKRTFAYLIELISYKSSDRIIVTSQEAKQYITGTYSVSPSKITLIPNYIDTDVFKPRKFDYESSKLNLCFVGRFHEQKNLFSLLEAIKGLNVKLIMIGNGHLLNQLKQKVEELEIDVEFKGIIPNNKVPFELNKSDIFVQPSFYEGNPKTILEAMACGLPVIGTNVAGINEIITHKENGLLCDTSPESIREAIQTLMNDKKLREILGKNAVEHIRENFSLDVLIKKEVNLLEKLICR